MSLLRRPQSQEEQPVSSFIHQDPQLSIISDLQTRPGTDPESGVHTGSWTAWTTRSLRAANLPPLLPLGASVGQTVPSLQPSRLHPRSSWVGGQRGARQRGRTRARLPPPGQMLPKTLDHAPSAPPAAHWSRSSSPTPPHASPGSLRSAVVMETMGKPERN